MKLLAIAVSCLSLVSATVMASEANAAGRTNLAASIPGDQMLTESQKNLKAGEAFLKQNQTKPGVVTLPDGLQYKIVTQGTGAKPTLNDTVTVHYAGTLIDGTEFDSSYKRNEPATFPVAGVIPGWTEALQLMPAGSTWELYIPANLAYGIQGAPPVIGPNQVLVFKVQLLDVKKS
jgi:FKBP-type peptidyl-prolyl cis-trans isomerase FklB